MDPYEIPFRSAILPRLEEVVCPRYVNMCPSFSVGVACGGKQKWRGCFENDVIRSLLIVHDVSWFPGISLLGIIWHDIRLCEKVSFFSWVKRWFLAEETEQNESKNLRVFRLKQPWVQKKTTTRWCLVSSEDSKDSTAYHVWALFPTVSRF